MYLLLALTASIILKFHSRARTSWPLLLAGMILALGAQAFRMYAASYLWGKQAVTEVRADFLCTSGPYAYMRNPLYLGNLIIGLSASIAINEWYAYVLFSLSWAFVYSIVIPYEERFLLAKWGDAYKEYIAHAGRLKPSLKVYKGKKEITPDYRAGILGEIHAPVVLIILFAVIYLLFLR